jgi:hypothetical protein
MKSKNA